MLSSPLEMRAIHLVKKKLLIERYVSHRRHHHRHFFIAQINASQVVPTPDSLLADTYIFTLAYKRGRHGQAHTAQ